MKAIQGLVLCMSLTFLSGIAVNKERVKKEYKHWRIFVRKTDRRHSNRYLLKQLKNDRRILSKKMDQALLTKMRYHLAKVSLEPRYAYKPFKRKLNFNDLHEVVTSEIFNVDN